MKVLGLYWILLIGWGFVEGGSRFFVFPFFVWPCCIRPMYSRLPFLSALLIYSLLCLSKKEKTKKTRPRKLYTIENRNYQH